ncbi:MAG TPA: zinc-dependent metalloprotease [Actinomycetota bacterium]|nr:zinc-dependent metalloprotease [Actinomycetota bacterium]
MIGGFGFDSGDPEAFKDAPLFQELQRVMSASSGPVNWELARQVGVANAVEAGPDGEPSEGDIRMLEEAVRVAELQVGRFTGLAAPVDVAQVRAVRRAGWVNANAESLKDLLEPAARRLTDAIERSAGDQLPPEMAQLSAFLRQLSPLLLGTQVGQVLGMLAQRVLGQYDIALPRSGPGQLLFVVPNLAAFERDWSLDPREFRTFVALHEVTHRFEFAQGWARNRFQELLDDYLSTVKLDVAGMQARLASLDPADPQALQQMAGSEEGLFWADLDDEQRLKLGRIQAFMAAAEGYGDHVMQALGAELLGTYVRIEEAMTRYREGEHGDPVFERLLGVDMKREQYRKGRAFCEFVVEQTDEATLARMWESADAMPSLPELDEPRLWLARTV